MAAPHPTTTTPDAVVDTTIDFPVIELRRYLVQPAERAAFATSFETWFPEAFQQLGALVFGSFCERGDAAGFTWLRGFADLDARRRVNEQFYDGPLWREHGPTMNARLVEYTNVLLLRPWSRARALARLPSVDPTRPEPPPGVVVAQLFAAPPGRVAALVAAAEAHFAAYAAAGAREAGLLVTLDVPNNYPRHPIREDGPYVVWLGLSRDPAAAARLAPLGARAAAELHEAGLLRRAAEWLELEPTRRSRLRWRG